MSYIINKSGYRSVLRLFLPVCGLLFNFLNSVFQRQKFLYFLKSSLLIYFLSCFVLFESLYDIFAFPQVGKLSHVFWRNFIAFYLNLWFVLSMMGGNSLFIYRRYLGVLALLIEKIMISPLLPFTFIKKLEKKICTLFCLIDQYVYYTSTVLS